MIEILLGENPEPPRAPQAARFQVLPQTPTPASPDNDGSRRINDPWNVQGTKIPPYS